VKKILCGIALATIFLPLPAGSQNNAPLDIQAAQQKVWDIQVRLNNARYRLAAMKLDLQRDKLSEALLKAQQKGDKTQITKIQQQLQNIDHLKALEQQRLDLEGQILVAQEQNNWALVQSLRTQIRELH